MVLNEYIRDQRDLIQHHIDATIRFIKGEEGVYVKPYSTATETYSPDDFYELCHQKLRTTLVLMCNEKPTTIVEMSRRLKLDESDVRDAIDFACNHGMLVLEEKKSESILRINRNYEESFVGHIDHDNTTFVTTSYGKFLVSCEKRKMNSTLRHKRQEEDFEEEALIKSKRIKT